MSNFLAPFTKQQFFLNNRAFNAGGFVYSYAAGTNTPQATYNATGAINPNPVVLDSRGSADIWLVSNTGYKINVTDASGNTLPGYPIDNIINQQLLTLYGGVDTGIANSYAVTFVANFTSYTNGIIIYFTASNTNTGPSTLLVNTLGPLVSILNQNGSQLSAGQIIAGQIVGVMYFNGNFILISSPLQVPYTSSFFGSLTGFVIGGNISCLYTLSGGLASITLPYFAGTSNATTFTVTGLPTSLQPASNKVIPIAVMQNNGAYITNANASIGPSGTITFNVGALANGWTGTGIKGIGYLDGSATQIGVTLAYNLL